MSHILFADDNEGIRHLVRHFLQRAGHSVELAADGQEALAAVERREPDLLVLDLSMPHLSGFDVCRAIKDNPFTAHIPILMLTAQNDIDHKVKGFELGADDYLGKPFESRELLARVVALLRMARREGDRNPTSGLPGGHIIHDEIARRIGLDAEFAVVYFDLSNFKPFADTFGFTLADNTIRHTGRALREAVEACGRKGDFVGHIGGDDFLAVTTTSLAEPIARDSTRCFAAALAEVLDADTLDNGLYTGVDREGVVRRFPLPQLVSVIVVVEPERWVSVNHLGAFAAELKRRARQNETSGLLVASV